MMQWIAKELAGGNQWEVYDQSNGRTVAIVNNKHDATMIAGLPDITESLKEMIDAFKGDFCGPESCQQRMAVKGAEINLRNLEIVP